MADIEAQKNQIKKLSIRTVEKPQLLMESLQTQMRHKIVEMRNKMNYLSGNKNTSTIAIDKLSNQNPVDVLIDKDIQNKPNNLHPLNNLESADSQLASEQNSPNVEELKSALAIAKNYSDEEHLPDHIYKIMSAYNTAMLAKYGTVNNEHNTLGVQKDNVGSISQNVLIPKEKPIQQSGVLKLALDESVINVFKEAVSKYDQAKQKYNEDIEQEKKKFLFFRKKIHPPIPDQNYTTSEKILQVIQLVQEETQPNKDTYISPREVALDIQNKRSEIYNLFPELKPELDTILSKESTLRTALKKYSSIKMSEFIGYQLLKLIYGKINITALKLNPVLPVRTFPGIEEFFGLDDNNVAEGVDKVLQYDKYVKKPPLLNAKFDSNEKVNVLHITHRIKEDILYNKNNTYLYIGGKPLPAAYDDAQITVDNRNIIPKHLASNFQEIDGGTIKKSTEQHGYRSGVGQNNMKVVEIKYREMSVKLQNYPRIQLTYKQAAPNSQIFIIHKVSLDSRDKNKNYDRILPLSLRTIPIDTIQPIVEKPNIDTSLNEDAQRYLKEQELREDMWGNGY